jgi:TctA family transporter
MADLNPAWKISVLPYMKEFYIPKTRILIHGQRYNKAMIKTVSITMIMLYYTTKILTIIVYLFNIFLPIIINTLCFTREE